MYLFLNENRKYIGTLFQTTTKYKILLKYATSFSLLQQLYTSFSFVQCTVGGQIKLGHLKFNLCKSDH
jgi:hypothetical protein